MRWDRLFAEIEQQAADEDLLERDALVADLTEEEDAETSWSDLVGVRTRLRVRGAGVVEGEVLGVRPALVHVRAAGADVLVASSAVLGVAPPGPRRPPAAQVVQRLGWPAAWRLLRDEQVDVVVVLVDGSRVAGRVARVGRDHVEVVGESGGAELLVYAALATVTTRD
ncbi:hypothetical protein [Aeromicrobium sp. IC_218]|uniref:hypothetical protein n=1 Tax=Aeromicrobium sp. IC_218 TaxID=2545468 RepID=UPI00103D5507|nr:hypothetical protein [Aeromicrobium sp. IC_218]TCI95682.1 hypothetical protein E0W78_16065 [Aeromicrobium sp. IC_218]